MSSQWIFDVGEREFEGAVVERSKRTPVLVDFWAPWCGPCQQLGPILERLVEEHAGSFLLAKVNVDEAPLVAGRYRVRSIPRVIGFRDGKIATEFLGAQPESVVRRALALLLPSEADERAADGERRFAAGDLEGAEAEFQAALEAEPLHAPAVLGHARILAERGEHGAALELLGQAAPDAELGREFERLAADLRTRQRGGLAAEALADLEGRVRAAPGDLEAGLALGRALAAAGRHEEALAELLRVVQQDSGLRDAARTALLDVLAILPDGDPLVGRYRRELGKALFR